MLTPVHEDVASAKSSEEKRERRSWTKTSSARRGSPPASSGANAPPRSPPPARSEPAEMAQSRKSNADTASKARVAENPCVRRKKFLRNRALEHRVRTLLLPEKASLVSGLSFVLPGKVLGKK